MARGGREEGGEVRSEDGVCNWKREPTSWKSGGKKLDFSGFWGPSWEALGRPKSIKTNKDR